MKKKKHRILIIIIILIAAIAIATVYLIISSQQSTKRIMPGSDRDEHGCIGSAGYSWCAPKNKCLRTWEEKCQ